MDRQPTEEIREGRLTSTLLTRAKKDFILVAILDPDFVRRAAGWGRPPVRFEASLTKVLTANLLLETHDTGRKMWNKVVLIHNMMLPHTQLENNREVRNERDCCSR